MSKAKLLNLICLLSFVFLLPSQALSKTATKPDQNCKINEEDPFENPARFTKDSQFYSGQCVDSERFRSALILEENEKIIKFANFQHLDQYWIATLEKNPKIIDKIFYQIVRFDVISGIQAAHIQYRVRLKSPMILENPQTQETIELSDFIVSFEAGRPLGVPYNFAVGVIDNLVLVSRIVSSAQRLKENIGHDIEQYELKFNSEDEALKFALSGILKSHKDGYSIFYNTLRPNCTTEVLDLVDNLPSQKNKNNAPFMTVISGDSVAGPSLRALKERGVLGEKYTDLKTEIEDGLSHTLPMEKEVAATLTPFIPSVPGYPFSLLFVLPKNEKVSPEKREELLKKTGVFFYQSIPEILLSVGSVSMSAENSTELLVKAFERFSENLKVQIKKWDQEIATDEPMRLQVYFVPIGGAYSEKVPLLNKWGIPAHMPMDVYLAEPEDEKGNIYTEISKGVIEIAQKDKSQKKDVEFQGIGMQIFVQKKQSEISLQVLSHLKENQFPLDVKNEQVELSELILPDTASSPYRLHPHSVFTLSYSVRQEDPDLVIEFGPYGGVNRAFRRLGRFQVLNDVSFCEARAYSVPRLNGVLGEKALGKGVFRSFLSWLFKGNKVSFGIFEVSYDLRNEKVKSTDVRVDTWPVSCRSEESVNQEFALALQEKVEGAKESMLEKITNHLLSNSRE